MRDTETNREVSAIIAKLPKEPEWVDETIKRNCYRYVFFDRKKDDAICSYCGKHFNFSEAKLCGVYAHDSNPGHRKHVYCPVCKNDAQALSKGYGRQHCEDHFRIAYWRKKGKTLYLSIQLVDVKYNYDTPEITKSWRALYVFGKGKPKYYRCNYGYFYGDTWTEPANVKYCTETSAGYGREGMYASDVYIRQSLPPLLAKSYYGYMPTGFFADQPGYEIIFNDMKTDIEIMKDFEKYPAIEVLMKTGFSDLIIEKIYKTGPYTALNWRSGDIKKIFRTNKADIKTIREKHLKLIDIENYRRIIKSGDYIPPEKIRALQISGILDIKNIMKVMKYSKAVKYIEKVVKQDPDSRLLQQVTNDYDDYIGEVMKLKLDTKRKDVLFPKDFYEAHSRASELVTNIEKKEETKEFKIAVEKTMDFNYKYCEGEYLIRPAKSPGELRYEGSSMGHCVGGYSDKVIEGRSVIMFIRKSKNPNKSFVTMEIDAKTLEIKQTRAKGNADPAEEVVQFAEDWIEMFKTEKAKDKKKKKLKKASQPVLAEAI